MFEYVDMLKTLSNHDMWHTDIETSHSRVGCSLVAGQLPSCARSWAWFSVTLEEKKEEEEEEGGRRKQRKKKGRREREEGGILSSILM